MTQIDDYDELSMETAWGDFLAREIQRAYWMLWTPMPTAPFARRGDVDLTLPPSADIETSFGDAVAHLLLAIEQVGEDPRELCRKALHYIAHVRDEIEQDLRQGGEVGAVPPMSHHSTAWTEFKPGPGSPVDSSPSLVAEGHTALLMIMNWAAEGMLIESSYVIGAPENSAIDATLSDRLAVAFADLIAYAEDSGLSPPRLIRRAKRHLGHVRDEAKREAQG